MHFDKRYLLLVLLALLVSMPSFGQRFTKKEQALREARAINYFYGHSFTLSTGLVHSWMAKDSFNENIFGRTGAYQNTRNSFDFDFAWDYCKSKQHGFKIDLAYAQFGGEKLFYYDGGLGYGPQLRDDLTETIHLNEVMLSGRYRYFIPLTYMSRLSLDAGIYFSRITGSYEEGKNWDMGALVGLGYDWKHVSCGIDYLPGVYSNVIKSSSTRVGALMFKVGWRFSK